MDLSGSGYGPVEGRYEHGNEPTGSIKYEFLDYLSNYLLLKWDLPSSLV
jgi:hypothetical protein